MQQPMPDFDGSLLINLERGRSVTAILNRETIQ
jgi:hypothetical protein